MSEERKRVHLRELFRTGKEVKFDVETDEGPQEVLLWIRKPTAGQQDEALNKAKGQQARRRNVYKDKDSDQYLSYWSDIEQMDSKEDLIDNLFKFDRQRFKTQAYNDVLYNEEYIPRDEDGEPKWGEGNQKYLELLVGIQNRMDEILKFNEELEDEDSDLWVKFEEDEELQRLEAERDEFESVVDERFEQLKNGFEVEHGRKKLEELRTLLMKRLIDSDASLAWYEEYRKWMLFFACRDYDDRTRTYFSKPDEVLELPGHVLQILEDHLNDLDRSGADIKNLPSLQPSFSS